MQISLNYKTFIKFYPNEFNLINQRVILYSMTMLKWISLPMNATRGDWTFCYIDLISSDLMTWGCGKRNSMNQTSLMSIWFWYFFKLSRALGFILINLFLLHQEMNIIIWNRGEKTSVFLRFLEISQYYFDINKIKRNHWVKTQNKIYILNEI